ncbi:MAG: hypothetical protein JXJ22_15610, partial [Bacteroidales bacterium]|nr:hypothetical protein [Bacteroidales bacterium]
VISRSLVRENRMQGSARGRLGNWPFYLDYWYILLNNNKTDVLFYRQNQRQVKFILSDISNTRISISFYAFTNLGR